METINLLPDKKETNQFKNKTHFSILIHLRIKYSKNQNLYYNIGYLIRSTVGR